MNRVSGPIRGPSADAVVWLIRMTDPDTIVKCTGCGTQLPRIDMFGVEPDLLCPRCADGVRRRMQVRVRTIRPDRKPVVTTLFLGIAIVLFVMTDFVFRSNPPTWLRALYQDGHVWKGEIYRHVTSIFLHGGWAHILLNGLALWSLGRVVEAGWGHLAMAGVMLATGVTGAVAQWIATGPAVGLSGGILGLCGFMWAQRRHHPFAAAVMNERMIRWIIMIMVVGVLLSATNTLPIGNWAHGGGLVMGALIGLAAAHRRRVVLLIGCAVLVAALAVVSIDFFFPEAEVQLTNGQTWTRQRWHDYWMLKYGGG